MYLDKSQDAEINVNLHTSQGSVLNVMHYTGFALNFFVHYPAGPVGLNFDWSARFLTGPSCTTCAHRSWSVSYKNLTNRTVYTYRLIIHR